MIGLRNIERPALSMNMNASNGNQQTESQSSGDICTNSFILALHPPPPSWRTPFPSFIEAPPPQRGGRWIVMEERVNAWAGKMRTTQKPQLNKEHETYEKTYISINSKGQGCLSFFLVYEKNDLTFLIKNIEWDQKGLCMRVFLVTYNSAFILASNVGYKHNDNLSKYL